jgi:hypothetical protein
MKIGLILPGNIWFCPYVSIYKSALNAIGVEYELISWNRDGSDKTEGIQFNRQYDLNGRISKFYPYIQYVSFIKKTVLQNKYDKLIVFGPQLAIFMNKFLSKRFDKKFIFDYRDLSIEQKQPFKHFFLKVLKHSAANVISSPGFKKCLPQGFDYLLSHNFNLETAFSAIELSIKNDISFNKINVLTIGGIRDYSSNIDIVNALANKERFHLRFVGKGAAAQRIKQYAEENGISNISFEGYYPKESEASYINDATFLNIFYPKVLTHSTALSNRFYNALIHKKPMIVTANSIQGDYVEKYNLGLSLNDCSELDEKLLLWLQQTDFEKFCLRCNTLLKDFINDNEHLNKVIFSFASTENGPF